MIKHISYLFSNYDTLKEYEDKLTAKWKNINKNIKNIRLDVNNGKLQLNSALQQYKLYKKTQKRAYLMSKRVKSIRHQSNEFYKRLTKKERDLINLVMSDAPLENIIPLMRTQYPNFYLSDYNKMANKIEKRWKTQTNISKKNIEELKKEIEKNKNYTII